jgi:hypothetical protein
MSVLGPVLTGFDMWLEEEARKLQAQHEGRVHWLFLMRDGFMPMQVHLARNPDDDAHAIECSRFTAIASSFAQERDITRYLETTLGTDPVALARHFSIPEADIARICPGEIPRPTASPVERDAQGHAQACDRGGITRLCAAAGSAYPQACAPEPGDVLMLVDVGYTGTVQNRVDAILAEAMDVHVAGAIWCCAKPIIPGWTRPVSSMERIMTTGRWMRYAPTHRCWTASAPPTWVRSRITPNRAIRSAVPTPCRPNRPRHSPASSRAS